MRTAQQASVLPAEHRPRPYLYIEQLAACTPWSADAIRTMMARGTFKLGVHYFKPHGRSGRPIFSWDAVVKYIEGADGAPQAGDMIPLADGTVIDLNEAWRFRKFCPVFSGNFVRFEMRLNRLGVKRTV